MRSSHRPLIGLALASLALGCSTTSQEDSAVDTAAFVVPEADHSWDYGSEITDEWPQEDSEYTYLRSEAADGTTVWFDFSRGLVDMQPDPLLSVLVGVNGDGAVVIHGLMDADGAESTFSPAVPLGPSSWEVGETSSSDSALDGTPLSWSVELAERGEHEVRYGLFPDAIRLEVNDGGATPLGGTWWLGANAGIIQLDTDDGLLGSLDLLTYR